MGKRSREELQRVMWGLAEFTRGDMDISKGARLLTVLTTLKVMLDNKDYFQVPATLNWNSISAPGKDITHQITQLVTSMEEHVSYSKGVFDSISWEQIEFKVLVRLIQELDTQDFSFEAMEDSNPLTGTIATVADGWFERVVRDAGRAIGFEIMTPIEVSELGARILQVGEGSAYDGTTGVGGMLIEAAREAHRQGKKVPELFGQEINDDTRSLGRANLILHGLHNAKIESGDTLTDPRLVDSEGNLMKFDYVLMQPPFALKVRDKSQFETDYFRRFRYGIPSAAHADMAFVQHAVASLNESGKAVLVQPHGVLFRSGVDEDIRRGLLEEGLIEGVIFLPRNLLYGTGIPVALLVVNKQNPHPDRIFFIRAEDEYRSNRIQNVLRSEDVQKIAETYRSRHELDGYSRFVTFDEIENNRWNLNAALYFDLAVVSDSKIGKVQVSLSTYNDSSTPKVKLSEIATIDRGFSTPKDPVDERATHRLINLGDVDEEGNIDVAKTTPITMDIRKQRVYELHAGDVLISSRGTIMKVAVVPERQEPLVASSNFIVIRLTKGIDPYFLKSFLDSPVGSQSLQAQQRGTTAPVLSHNDVHDILIPKLPIEEQRKIANEADAAEQAYKDAVNEAKRQYQERYRDIYRSMHIEEALKPVDDTDEER